MRELGFSKLWPKLAGNTFTTFRYPRMDKDWQVGETVRIVIMPRRPTRQVLGEAQIIAKGRRELDPFFTDGKIIRAQGVPLVTEAEAIADGFQGREEMVRFMEKTYGLDYLSCFNMLTLRWEWRGVKPELKGRRKDNVGSD